MINIDEKLEGCVFINDYKKLIESLDDEREKFVLQLGEAADILADAGRIHNTPYSKMQWIEVGRTSLPLKKSSPADPAPGWRAR